MSWRRVGIVALVAFTSACDKRSGSGAEPIATPEPLPASTADARAHGGTRARAAVPAGFDLAGLWYIHPLVNVVSKEDHETRVSIERGDAAGSYSVVGVGGVRFRGVATIDGAPPRLRIDATDERYACDIEGGGIVVSCDNGEPPGIGRLINPKHRSFGLVRLCPADGGTAFCSTRSAADGAPPGADGGR